MFLHIHPYRPFITEKSTKLVVGTLPPPRFTTRELKHDDVDFCYGSRNGMLWPILDRIFDLGLKYENTSFAVEQRKKFLLAQKIGVCDIVAKAERAKLDASDLGMQNVELRDLVSYLQKFKKLETVLFMGGNSKNGPEYFFRKLLKAYGIKLERVSEKIPRIHRFVLPESDREIETVSLIAPSGAANRAVGSLADFKKIKGNNPLYNTMDYRVDQYRPFFRNE